MAARYDIIRTAAEQPYRVVLIAGNGEPVLLSGDHYADIRDARNAIRLAQDTVEVRLVDERFPEETT